MDKKETGDTVPMTDRSQGLPPASTGPKSQEETNKVKVLFDHEANPAGGTAAQRHRTMAGVTRETRVPINSIDRKLEVPEIEGFHLHWFLELNIAIASRAGYTMVEPGELPDTVSPSIGGRAAGAHSEDLGGSRVTALAGETGRDNIHNVVQLVLMKIPLEWYHDDQRRVAERNYSILSQIFGKRIQESQPIRAVQMGESDGDYRMRYTKEAVFDLRTATSRKAPQGA